MNSVNARFNRKRQYSRRVIREAFSALLETIPADKITVKLICDKADVNRSTFYANYVDIYALRHELKEEYTATLLPLFQAYDGMDERQFYHELFRLVYENAWICRTVTMLDDPSLTKQFTDCIYDKVVAPRKSRLSPEVADELDMIFEFSSAGCYSLIRKWILRGMDTPFEKMASCLHDLSTRCIGTVDKDGIYRKPAQVSYCHGS